jgi:hypothetical protein
MSPPDCAGATVVFRVNLDLGSEVGVAVGREVGVAVGIGVSVGGGDDVAGGSGVGVVARSGIGGVAGSGIGEVVGSGVVVTVGSGVGVAVGGGVGVAHAGGKSSLKKAAMFLSEFIRMRTVTADAVTSPPHESKLQYGVALHSRRTDGEAVRTTAVPLAYLPSASGPTSTEMSPPEPTGTMVVFRVNLGSGVAVGGGVGVAVGWGVGVAVGWGVAVAVGTGVGVGARTVIVPIIPEWNRQK